MSTDFYAMAQTMFGDTTPSIQTDFGADFRAQLAGTAPMQELPEREDVTDQQRAEEMFGRSDPELQFGDAMREIERAVLEQLGDPREASETAATWGAVFQSAGLSHAEAAMVTSAAIGTITSPPQAEVVLSWREEARTALMEDFGPGGANQALIDARRWVETFGTPELRDVLNTTGLGDHPAIVRTIAAKARQARVQGLLR